MRTQFRFRTRKPETMHFIETEVKPIRFDKKYEGLLAFRRFLLTYWWAFLIVMGLFLYGFRSLYNSSTYYQCESIIVFRGLELPEFNDNYVKNQVPSFNQISETYNRMFQLVYSKEMFDHLIEKFNLTAYYGLAQLQEPYLDTRKAIKNSITLTQNNQRALSLRVRDYGSGKMAADIANEIVVKANDLNRDYIESRLESRSRLYSRMHDEIKSKMSDDLVALNRSVSELKGILARFQTNNYKLEEAGRDLSALSEMIDGNLVDLVKFNKLNSWTMNTSGDDILTSIHVLEDALPPRQKAGFTSWILVPGSLLTAFLLTLFIFNLVYSQRDYLRVLFSRT